MKNINRKIFQNKSIILSSDIYSLLKLTVVYMQDLKLKLFCENHNVPIISQGSPIKPIDLSSQ